MRPELRLKIVMSVAVAGPLLGVLLAIYLSWNRLVFASDIFLLLSFYVVTAFGITIGYHRMLTHQGFRAPDWLRGLLLILGCMGFMGRPDTWAATHIRHHAHADEEGDPHSPLEGFWHAHLGWLFHLRGYGDVAVYAPHLLQDRVVQFVSRRSLLWEVLALLIPFAIGGWTGLLWGGIVRVFFTTHITWSVNSVCHVFGRRAFATTDESRNEWVVGLLAFGEGWHNNHHAFPRNAFHGLQWWQFDLSGLLIRLLERFGLVWDVQRVGAEAIAAHRVRSATVQESLAQLREQLVLKIHEAQRDFEVFLDRHGRPPITDAQVLRAVASCEEAAARLQDIRERVALASQLKKQRLHLYLREVQELGESLRASKAAL